MTLPILETERFRLRPLRATDSARLFETLSREEPCRYLSRPAFPTLAELEAWLFSPTWPGRTWVAEPRDGAPLAGRFIAVDKDEEGLVEIGYVTAFDRQRQGVARECVTAVIDHLIHTRGYRKIMAEVDTDNEASVRLLERLGFTREAHLREHETTHIGLRDLFLYGLLAREWPNKP